MGAIYALGTACVLAGAGGAQFMIFADPRHDPLVLAGLLTLSAGFMLLAWAEHIRETRARRTRHETWRREVTQYWLPGV